MSFEGDFEAGCGGHGIAAKCFEGFAGAFGIGVEENDAPVRAEFGEDVVEGVEVPAIAIRKTRGESSQSGWRRIS